MQQHFFLKSRYLPIFLLIFILTTVACSQQKPESADSSERFFSLKNYFAQEIKRLETTGQSLEKEAFLNGQSETQKRSEVDWKQELDVFMASDINKNSWRDKYVIDSIQKNGFLMIRYQHQDPKLRTKSIELAFKPQQNLPSSIKIFNEVNNPLYQTKEELYYQANQGFTIHSTQAVTFLKVDSLHIIGQFLR